MGLLDFLNTEEGRMGLGLLAAAGPRTDGIGFGGRIQEAMRGQDEWKKAQQEAAYRKAQMEEAQQAALERKLAREQAIRNQEAVRGAFTPMAGGAAMANGQGPTIGNAANIGQMPQFDPRQFLAQNPQADVSALKQVMELQDAMKPKARKLMSVAPGNVVFDESSGSPVFTAPTAPKEPTPTELARLIQEMESLPQGHPSRRIYQQQIQKMTSHAPGVSVTYGAPVAGVDANGNPVFFQPSKDGGTPSILSGVAPPPREKPAALQEKVAQNAVTLNKINLAEQAIAQYPDAFGLKNVAGDTIMQRLDPKGTEARAMIADIAGQKIHDRSGAAVTVGEAERLKPYIPNVTDSPETVAKKLKLFKAEYNAMQQAINSGASLSQITKSQQETQPTKSVVRTGTYNGKKVIQYSDGTTEYAN